MTFFLVIDLFSLFFPCLCCLTLSRIYLTCKSLFSSRKRLFHTQKIPFFLFSYFRTLPCNTTSPNIGGTNAWAVPHLKFGGNRPPSPPLGLRLCLRDLNNCVLRGDS